MVLVRLQRKQENVYLLRVVGADDADCKVTGYLLRCNVQGRLMTDKMSCHVCKMAVFDSLHPHWFVCAACQGICPCTRSEM